MLNLHWLRPFFQDNIVDTDAAAAARQMRDTLHDHRIPSEQPSSKAIISLDRPVRASAILSSALQGESSLPWALELSQTQDCQLIWEPCPLMIKTSSCQHAPSLCQPCECSCRQRDGMQMAGWRVARWDWATSDFVCRHHPFDLPTCRILHWRTFHPTREYIFDARCWFTCFLHLGASIKAVQGHYCLGCVMSFEILDADDHFSNKELVGPELCFALVFACNHRAKFPEQFGNSFVIVVCAAIDKPIAPEFPSGDVSTIPCAVTHHLNGTMPTFSWSKLARHAHQAGASWSKTLPVF